MTEPFKNRDVIAIEEFTKEEILTILDHAARLKKEPRPNLLEGTLLGSCFFEPSTRTRLSFESAMHRLGGRVMGFADSGSTSMSKGETLQDAMKMMGCYVDLVVLRHPHEGAAQVAADAVDIPVINAGDGANQHPTQTLLDLFSILETQKTLEGLDIAMVGDLRYGRTTHSLARALTHFGARLYFVAPTILEMPQDICDDLRDRKIKFSFHKTIQEVLPKVDILYMTRVQSERFTDAIEYDQIKECYHLRAADLKGAKSTMKVMHPLPRRGEIAADVDMTPHAYYFEQAKNGLYTRQALLGLLLGKLD
ncbi:MAG: aspartate carbamoyltransferase [Chlamydiales bacterium]|nr:aspartate carbamoyltransferase [Chlamydiia bacterium]MCP5508357.1 aspartate carbamoyltransferase [Chlamydiales bacterium]